MVHPPFPHVSVRRLRLVLIQLLAQITNALVVVELAAVEAPPPKVRVVFRVVSVQQFEVMRQRFGRTINDAQK